MDNIIDFILSDQFVEYSKQITEIHVTKKAKTEEAKPAG